ncbi:MAG: hypothetical protein RLZZ417_2933, partial [Bacteroidota bacterium]
KSHIKYLTEQNLEKADIRRLKTDLLKTLKGCYDYRNMIIETIKH